MTAATFDFAPLLPAGLPAPAARWTGLAKYSFVGGNNDPEQVPLDGLIDADSRPVIQQLMSTHVGVLRDITDKKWVEVSDAGEAAFREKDAEAKAR